MTYRAEGDGERESKERGQPAPSTSSPHASRPAAAGKGEMGLRGSSRVEVGRGWEANQKKIKKERD